MQEPPRIEFPCEYPIKVIVEVSADVIHEISGVVKRYDGRLSSDKISQNPSRNGKFVSIRFQFWATGETQIQQLFLELKKNPAVRMVL